MADIGYTGGNVPHCDLLPDITFEDLKPFQEKYSKDWNDEEERFMTVEVTLGMLQEKFPNITFVPCWLRNGVPYEKVIGMFQ